MNGGRRAVGAEIHLLGSAGFMPTDERETCCALLRDGREGLLVDAGTGVRRLVANPSLVEGLDRLHVVLTHFHLDHVCGLFYLGDVEVPAEVWGAGEALEGTPTSELVGRLLGSPFAPPSFLERLAVRELPLPVAEVGPFRIRSRIQRKHANSTLALRVNEELVWCTDTAYDEENVAFARGARILFHEAFYPGEVTEDPGHTAAGEAARLAAGAGVERLVLIHTTPDIGADDELLRFARPHFPAAEVGRDGPV